MAVKKKGKRIALSIALVGIMAATVECAKLALAALPNIEVVTFLLAIYSYVFGGMGILAALIFVAIEPLIWGFGTWIISYFIYWPLVAVIFFILGRARTKNLIVITSVAVGLTVFFGVLSSLVDVGLFSGSYTNFFTRFAIYYSRGILFYVAQTATNAIVFPLLFRPLGNSLLKMKGRMGI